MATRMPEKSIFRMNQTQEKQGLKMGHSVLTRECTETECDIFDLCSLIVFWFCPKCNGKGF